MSVCCCVRTVSVCMLLCESCTYGCASCGLSLVSVCVQVLELSVHACCSTRAEYVYVL